MKKVYSFNLDEKLIEDMKLMNLLLFPEQNLSEKINEIIHDYFMSNKSEMIQKIMKYNEKM